MKHSIAVVADGFFTPGGAVVSTRRFAIGLARRGHNVIVITTKPSRKVKLDEKNLKVRYFSGLPLPGSKKSLRFALPPVFEFMDILEQNKVDVVYFCEPMVLGLIALKASRTLGIPVVTSNHFQPYHITLNVKKLDTKLIEDILNTYLSVVYNKCDAVIAPSRASLEYLESIGVKTRRVIISNGVPTDVFRPQRVRLPRHIPRGKKIILSVCRLHADKCVDVTIKAMPHIVRVVPDAHLVIVGTGMEMQSLRTLIKQYGLAKNITFAGHVSDAILPHYYNAADVFVSASNTEIEGMSVLEAMACGKPVVISNSKDNAARQFIHGNGYVFEQSNPIDMARRVTDVLTDRRMQHLGSSSRRIAIQYSFDKSLNRMEKLIDSVILNGMRGERPSLINALRKSTNFQ